MQAPIPIDEAARLAVLHSYEVLDTPAEPSFDRITRLVSRLFNVPIVLISFVDENRQWFKSHCGFEAQQTGRDVSFCAHAILKEEVLFIPDATLDPRFAQNPLVLGEPRVRFYAGAPLRTQQGVALGTLCLIDHLPRTEFSAEQSALLAEFAGLVIDELERSSAASRVLSAERALVASEVRFHAFMENSPSLKFLRDESGKMLYTNPAFERTWGKEPWSLEATSFLNSIDLQPLSTNPQELVALMPPGGGAKRHFLSVKFPFLDGEGGTLWGGVALDITDRILAEQERERVAQESLEEKETLLREVHHRVKNNLQIISSLLSMQSRLATDEQSRAIFNESQNRVLAMAAIHEHLYKDSDLTHVNMKPYIDQIISNLRTSFGGSLAVTFQIEAFPQPLFLAADHAIPTGLILNELVSNCLKHAFPGGRAGKVTITIKKLEGIFTLIVADDGLGLPENFQFPGTTSLGMRLVDVLTKRQLRGNVSVVSKAGSTVTVSFPLEAAVEE